MKRAVVLGVLAALALPVVAHAKIDLSCSTTTASSAIGGVVEDARGNVQPGLKVELYQPNRQTPTADFATTDANGRYRICAGEISGSGHDTYDVHVRDLRPAPEFALASQPYSTYTDLADADFTPESGNPLYYLANLTISPANISTATGPRTVTWSFRSKAPASTVVRLTVGHRQGQSIVMTPDAPEGGGPANGGWNRWRYADTFGISSTEKLYWAAASGSEGTTRITQTDQQPYTIDNTPPILGPAEANAAQCGSLIVANGFSPASPPGTTNQLPVVTHGVCDYWANGARSGIDPFALRGKLCLDKNLTSGCKEINPVLNAHVIVWYASEPLPYGDYYIGWRVVDYAGNVTENPLGYKLSIVTRGGQIPVFNTLQPGTFGSGTTSGIVVGSSLTSPQSYPYIGFRVLDADGQTDLAPGTLRMRVYYGDERNLVYEYDITKGKNEYDPVTAKGGANWDLTSGIFRADGFPLQGKPPGRYVATASISDRGGNSQTVTWHWILAAAV